MHQVRLLGERVYELNTIAVRNRLHCESLRLSLAAGLADNRALIDPAPTHAELAARIGTHREAVTRELQYLTGRNIVANQDRSARRLGRRIFSRQARDDAGMRIAPDRVEPIRGSHGLS